MASSSIIATNIITIIVIIIIIIIIIVHHRRRCRKSIIRSGKSLNERFPLTERKRKKCPLLEYESTCWRALFYVSYWRRDDHFPWSPELRGGLAFCRVKAVPSCVAFKPLCKREHPRIVRFSSLYNAYVDKLCHSHDCLGCTVSSKCFVTL